MHHAAFSFIAAHLPGDAVDVLEFGSRNINGTVRDLVPGTRFVGVDIVDGDGVDVVADCGTTLHLGVNHKFDVVVCAEVFEHASDRACLGMVENAHHWLRKGGVFIVTAAGPARVPHSAFDGAELRDGEFYRNVTSRKLTGWLERAGFDSFTVDELGDDIRAVAVK